MPILTDENQALERLQMLVQYNVDPTLEIGELEELLNKNQRGSVWEASTAYSIGDVVIPTSANRNGHRYVCISFDGDGVESDTTEPSWSTSRDATIADGNLTWREDGDEFDLWDLTQAAYDGWMLKAAKAACRVDFKAGDSGFTNSQVFTHCERMANRYRGVMVA